MPALLISAPRRLAITPTTDPWLIAVGHCAARVSVFRRKPLTNHGAVRLRDLISRDHTAGSNSFFGQCANLRKSLAWHGLRFLDQLDRPGRGRTSEPCNPEDGLIHRCGSPAGLTVLPPTRRFLQFSSRSAAFRSRAPDSRPSTHEPLRAATRTLRNGTSGACRCLASSVSSGRSSTSNGSRPS